MMRTLCSGSVCLALLACLLAFTACTQTTEDQLLVENKLEEVGKDYKVMRAGMQDLEMEIEVLNEQLDYLRSEQTSGSPVDDAQLKNLEGRLATMETSLSDVKMRAVSIETRTTSMEKKTTTLSNQVAALPKQIEALKSSITAQSKAQPSKSTTAVAQLPKSTSQARPAVVQAPPTAARPAASSTAGFYYTLQQGDTIESIAETLQVGGAAIRSINRVPDGYQPLIGQRIYIPTA